MNVTQGELKRTALRPAGAIEAGQPGPQPTSVYSADAALGPDHLGRAAHAHFLAEVVAHRAAGTPLCMGIFGPAGSGKSSFAASLLAGVEAISRAATAAGIATPFHGGIAVVRVAARPGLDAGRALMTAVGGVLARSHPRLLGRIAHAGLDPRSVARAATEQLSTARAQLETERQALDGLAGRQARLAETVLFETDGSGVDAYVRGNRARIERRMRAFGVTHEPLTAFKGHVRDAHEAHAPLTRATGWLRAFYGYRGQGALLMLVLVLMVAAWCLSVLDENQDRVIDAVRSGSDKAAGLADWLQAQWHWLTPARHLAELGAAAALAINIVRGVSFLMPVQRGVDLLRSDLENRRRELDSRLAHQTRRVDSLGRDVNRLSQQSAEADGRVLPGADALSPLLLSGDDGVARAHHFFGALGEAIADAGSGQPQTATSAPTRLVVSLDGLDQLSSAEAANVVQTAASLLARPGMVLVLAADHAHLAAGLAETDPALAAECLRRLVQVPFDLGSDDSWTGAAAYARALLDGDEGAGDDGAVVDAAVSALDRPWTAAEGRVLEAVAPLAGTTPRDVKHLVNLYRIARADPGMRDASAKDLAGLALGLALRTRGLPPAMAETATRGEGADEIFDARRAIGVALGVPFNALEGRHGFDVARTYSIGR